MSLYDCLPMYTASLLGVNGYIGASSRAEHYCNPADEKSLKLGN